MSEERKMPRGWNTLYKSLPKEIREYIDAGEYMDAYTHVESYKDTKVIVQLFLMQHHADKWDEMAKDDWFVKRYVSYCCEEYDYFAESANAFDFFKKNKKVYKMEYATDVVFVDKFIELHNGQIPTNSGFFDRIADISSSFSEEDYENPPLEILDFCNKK